MSLTLKGYDLFSLGQFRAALQEAVLPAAAERAGLAPAILASIRSLGLGEAHEAAAAILLEEVLSRGSGKTAPAVGAEPPIRLAFDVILAQAQPTCDGGGSGGNCDILPEQYQDRGVGNYSG